MCLVCWNRYEQLDLGVQLCKPWTQSYEYFIPSPSAGPAPLPRLQWHPDGLVGALLQNRGERTWPRCASPGASAACWIARTVGLASWNFGDGLEVTVFKWSFYATHTS